MKEKARYQGILLGKGGAGGEEEGAEGEGEGEGEEGGAEDRGEEGA